MFLSLQHEPGMQCDAPEYLLQQLLSSLMMNLSLRWINQSYYFVKIVVSVQIIIGRAERIRNSRLLVQGCFTKNMHLVRLFSEIVYCIIYFKQVFIIYKTCQFIASWEIQLNLIESVVCKSLIHLFIEQLIIFKCASSRLRI